MQKEAGQTADSSESIFKWQQSSPLCALHEDLWSIHGAGPSQLVTCEMINIWGAQAASTDTLGQKNSLSTS